MTSVSTARRLTLILAIALLTAVTIVLACTPAAPTAHDKPEQGSVPTLTPTPASMFCETVYGPRGKPWESCVPLVPPTIDPDLQVVIDHYMVQKEKLHRSGQTIEPQFMHITVLIKNAEDVDPVVTYLQENTESRVRSSEEPGALSMGASANVNIEMIPTIAAMEGIRQIIETPTTRPDGYNRQGGDTRHTHTADTNPNYVTQIVRRHIAGANPLSWTDSTVGINDTTYSDTTAVSGTTYVYRISALKANSKGGVSNAITIQVP